jgi:hypothetical protein
VAGGSTEDAGLGADALARAHAALLGQGDLQFSLTPFQATPPPAWLKSLAQFLASIAPVFPYIFWTGLIIGGLAILVFVLREAIGLRLPKFRRRPRPPAEPEWRPSAARARTLLEDADRLAAQGRFGEAAHLILFRSIEDIDASWPNLVRPALTSRDIAAHRGLPETARRTFGDIARVVEQSVFGGAELAADDFIFCRRAYERFAFPGVQA